MNRNRSEWALKERRNELACQVTDAYYKLLLEERMLDLALEQSRLSERYLKQTEAFVELGLKSVSDLQEVKARREGDIYRYQARQNGCRLALLRLKQLLNLHAEGYAGRTRYYQLRTSFGLSTATNGRTLYAVSGGDAFDADDGTQATCSP